MQLARKTYTLDSYRLPLAAAEAGFTGFAHHDATADAEACAHIVIDAARRHGVTDVSALADVAGIRVGRLEAAVPAAAQVEAADPPFVPMALESVA